MGSFACGNYIKFFAYYTFAWFGGHDESINDTRPVFAEAMNG